jgi:cytoskeletal protein RodZ
MGSFAADLKSEREKRSVPLSQIASETRISLHYLVSLEEGRYDELPGGIYNRAFVRAYCDCLNLDQQAILQRYETEVTAPQEKIFKPKVQIPPSDRSFNLNPAVVWGLMLLISAAGIFFSRKWIAEVFSPYFSGKPPITAPVDLAKPPQVSPRAAMTPAPDSGISASTPTSPTAPEPQDSISTTPVPHLSMPADESSAQMAPSTDPTSPLPSSALRLEIGVTEKCWVSVDRDGTPGFRRLMEPGEVQSLYAAEQFMIILGNAGGAHLKINGKPLKSLGKAGEVVKTLINQQNLPDLLVQNAG